MVSRLLWLQRASGTVKNAGLVQSWAVGDAEDVVIGGEVVVEDCDRHP